VELGVNVLICVDVWLGVSVFGPVFVDVCVIVADGVTKAV
jgi:hypothetical protein